MGRVLIGLLIVTLGVTSINLYKRFTEHSDFKVKFHVYSLRTGKPLEILFRTIPTLYDTMIDVDIIEPFGKELNLYKINNDIYGGTPDLHYVVYDKGNRQIRDLKSDFLLRRFRDLENVDFDTIDSYSIDISTFKEIFDPHLKTSEEIADKYAELLASSVDSTDFKRIRQIGDIKPIKDLHSSTHNPLIDEDEIIRDFTFVNHLVANEFLYWFYDKGLVKIRLDFDDGSLKNVKTLRVGNLGIETTHL